MNEDLKKAVYNVYSYFKKESQCGHHMISIHKVVPRVACAMKISQKTVRRILYEKENRCVLDVVESMHKSFLERYPQFRKRQGAPPKWGHIDDSVIRIVLHKLHADNENQCVTVRNLRKKLQSLNIEANIGLTRLYSSLGKMGFMNSEIGTGKKTARVSLREHQEMVSQRQDYLAKLKKYRSNGFNVVFVNEFWLSANHVCDGEWGCNRARFLASGCLKCLKSDVKNSEPGLLILDGASEKFGFIPGAELVFPSDFENGYHQDHINPTVYLYWFENYLLKNLTTQSVIVLENTNCNSTVTETTVRYPVSKDKKETMLAWLKDHNIQLDKTLNKDELFQLVKQHKSDPVYEVDKLAVKNGHFVFRVPAKHRELNAIKFIQAKIRCSVGMKNNSSLKLPDFQKLYTDVKETYGLESWKTVVDQVIEYENLYRRTDGIEKTSLKPAAVDLTDSDMSESTESAFTDDDSDNSDDTSDLFYSEEEAEENESF